MNISPSTDIIDSTPYLITKEYLNLIDQFCDIPSFYVINLIESNEKALTEYYSAANVSAFLQNTISRFHYQLGISSILDYEKSHLRPQNLVEIKFLLSKYLTKDSIKSAQVPIILIKLPHNISTEHATAVAKV